MPLKTLNENSTTIHLNLKNYVDVEIIEVPES